MQISLLLSSLKAKSALLATVESCTGGKIAQNITSIAGASESYWGGWIVYDNSAKIELLDVSKALLEKNGAVSPEVALALAENGLKKMKRALDQSKTRNPSQLVCISTTGIAGPSGGTATKPVGLCYLGLATFLGSETREIRGPSQMDRNQMQDWFTQQAFDFLDRVSFLN